MITQLIFVYIRKYRKDKKQEKTKEGIVILKNSNVIYVYIRIYILIYKKNNDDGFSEGRSVNFWKIIGKLLFVEGELFVAFWGMAIVEVMEELGGWAVGFIDRLYMS